MKKMNAFLTLTASLGLAFALSATGYAGHSVAIDAGKDSYAISVRDIVGDILASRGYDVTDRIIKEKSENPSEIYVKLLISDEPDVYVASSMDQQHAGDNYVTCRSLAQNIMDAYTNASQRTFTVVDDTAALDKEIPSCQIHLNAILRMGHGLDYTSESDLAYAAYIIANGIDAYFYENDGISQAMAAQKAQEEAAQQAAAAQAQQAAQAQTQQTTQVQALSGQPVAPGTFGTPTPIPIQNHSGEGQLSPSTAYQTTTTSIFQNTQDEITLAQNKLTSALLTAYEALPTNNGRWAIYACDLKHIISGYAPSSANQPMQAASLIKLYICAAVYENYENLVATYGAATLDSYLSAMITVSDNDAANALVSCLGNGDTALGMQVVNSYCQSHGYTATSMGRLLLQSNEFGDNYTSVRDCGRLLTDIYRSVYPVQGSTTTVTDPLPHAQEMFNLLKNQQRRNKIPANMPYGVNVANKTGELLDVENDAGIIYETANGNDLVLIFMSENLVQTGAAQQTIAQISRFLYDTYQN